MLNKDILKIIKQLNEDLPDFYMCYPALRKAIAEWIKEDRLYQKRKSKCLK